MGIVVGGQFFIIIIVIKISILVAIVPATMAWMTSLVLLSIAASVVIRCRLRVRLHKFYVHFAQEHCVPSVDPVADPVAFFEEMHQVVSAQVLFAHFVEEFSDGARARLVSYLVALWAYQLRKTD